LSRGLRWTPLSELDDPDFAKDLALLYNTKNTQEKTNLSRFGGRVDWQISQKNTPVISLKYQHASFIENGQNRTFQH